ISSGTINSWLSSGHGLGVHFDDTAEVDGSGVGGSHATWAGMNNVMNTALGSLKTTYPSVPAPTTVRDHFLIWVSNGSTGNVDQTAQAKLFQNFGVQMDVTYSSFPNRWG